MKMVTESESVSHSVVSNLGNHMGCSPPGSSAHRISQARMLEWVAIPSFRRSSRVRDQTCISCIPGRFFTTWLTMKMVMRFSIYVD